MKKKTNTHGGARKGAGRPVGTGPGRTVVTKSVTMPIPAWDRLDRDRKDESRGEYIARKLSL